MNNRPIIQYRQGDVLLEKVDKIPDNSVKREKKLLASGEKANHGHFVFNATVFKSDETLYVDVAEEGELRHLDISTKEPSDEHRAVSIPPGKYRVIRQREYDPYERKSKEVED